MSSQQSVQGPAGCRLGQGLRRGPQCRWGCKGTERLGQAKPHCFGGEGAPGRRWAGWGGERPWRPQRTKRLGLPGYSVELELVVGLGEGPWQSWELRLLPPSLLPHPDWASGPGCS